MSKKFVQLSIFIFSFIYSLTGNSAVISLDFEDSSNGCFLANGPLNTSFGAIELMSDGDSKVSIVEEDKNFYLKHTQRKNSDFAELSFSFDVDSLDFWINGNGGGEFYAEVLDIGRNIIAKRFFSTTSDRGFDLHTIIIEPGIRFFRFMDSHSRKRAVSIDKLRLKVDAIPVSSPTTGIGVLFVLTISALLVLRRKNRL